MSTRANGRVLLVRVACVLFPLTAGLAWFVDMNALTSQVPDGGAATVVAHIGAALFALSLGGSAFFLWLTAWFDLTKTTRHESGGAKVAWGVALVIGNFLGGWIYSLVYLTATEQT